MCHKCDSKLPHKYSYAGPHIKEVCGSCGAYFKFASKNTIPSFIESKQLIWAITTDIKLINETKVEMGVFHKDLKGMYANVAYHNLYVNIVKKYFS
jgi:hypothetical protein